MKKTNTLTKLLALVLSLVMMCSMSVSAFAAEVADVEYASDIENCEVITIDLDEILDDADIENLNTRGNEMTSGHWDLTLFTCTVGGASRVTLRCDRVEG